MINPEFIRLEHCPSIAWRNGGGSMRLIATHPPEAAVDDFDWRISIAKVAQDSPFSAFPGYDRCIALLSGNGMVLSSDDPSINHRLENQLEPFYFSGEIGIHARLINGPLYNLSVLARRGQHRISLTPLETPTCLAVAARSTPVLIYCLSGSLLVESHGQEPLVVIDGELVLWRSGAPEMTLNSANKRTQAIAVDLPA